MENLFICLFVTCISSLKRCLLKILAHFLIWLFPYCWVLSVLSIFWLTVLYQTWLANIFSHSMAHFLTLLMWFYCFLQDRSFNFNDVQCINYLFHGSPLLVLPCLFYSLHLIILLTYFKIWFSHLCFCSFFLMTNFPSPCLPYRRRQWHPTPHTYIHTYIHTYTHLQIFCTSVSSVTQSCPTLCDPMDCSTPGFPVHHQCPELT